MRERSQRTKSQILTNHHRNVAFSRAKRVTRPEGLEPSTYGLEIRCSIRLSYGRNCIGKSAWTKRFCLRFSRCYSTVGLVKQRKPTKTWERTRLQNLVRHKSGRYYARAFAGGKEVWKSLKTSHFSVAQAKLAEFLKEHRERVSNGNGEVSAKMTFGEAAAIHLRNLDDNLSIKPRTRDYWRECLAALQKSWPGLNETEVRRSRKPIAKNGRGLIAKRSRRLVTTTLSRFFGTFSTSPSKLASFTATLPLL